MLGRCVRVLSLAGAIALCLSFTVRPDQADALFLRKALKRAKRVLKTAASKVKTRARAVVAKVKKTARNLARKIVRAPSRLIGQLRAFLKRGIDLAKKKFANLKNLSRLFTKVAGRHYINFKDALGKARKIELPSLAKLGAKAARALRKRLRLPEPKVRTAAARLEDLKPSVDLRSGFGPARNQRWRGTCVAHATLAAMEYAFKGNPADLSEQYAYYMFKQNDDTPCEGGYPTTAAPGVIMTNPIPAEKDWSYRWFDPANLFRKTCSLKETYGAPSSKVKAAAKYTITGYTAIPNNGADYEGISLKKPETVMGVLNEGYPVVVGFGVAGSGWDWWKQLWGKTIDVEKGKDGKPLPADGAGHAVVLVGYDMAKKAFLVRNSWGKIWGRKGYGWLSFDYLRTYASAGYYINSVAIK